METAFDPLKFYDDLKAADVPEKQARAQAEAIRNAFAAYAAGKMKELATKGDIKSVRLEMKEIEMRLSKRIEAGKHETLKWLIALLLTQSAFLVAIFAYLK